MDAAIARALRRFGGSGMLIVKFMVVSSLCFAQEAGAVERYWYGFAFDLTDDNQHAEALDYQYRYGKNVLVQMPRAYVQAGRIYMRRGEGGNFPAGTSLYFKWRDTQTRKIYEETANLKGRLLGDLERCEVTLLIIDNHLHVFLVRHEDRPTNMPALGPKLYEPLKVYEIYPAHSNPGFRSSKSAHSSSGTSGT